MNEDTKYTFIETTGCTAGNFTVNESSLSDIPNEELDKILDYLFSKIKEGIQDNTILFEDVVKVFQSDSYEYDNETCEQCGDNVQTTTWKI
jgi:uncharacterized Fe-S cluster-containing MiaB family protein